jgi:hypothetical protein
LLQRVLGSTLLVDLLEEAKRRLLGLVDFLLDGVGGGGRVTCLALGGELTELSDELLDLGLLLNSFIAFSVSLTTESAPLPSSI